MRDPICAISTAPGEGGIAIVRVSGENSLEIFRKAFVPAGKKEVVSHKMLYGFAVDADGRKIDEAMGVFFAAPSTYTREDVFEIQCHGGSVCARRVLERILQLGARAAEPGEFTKRAFLNGRIDLSRAEAVMSLIGANSEAAARSSVRQLEGGVSAFVNDCADKLKNMLSLVEACTDFPEEVEEEDAARQILAQAKRLISDLEKNCDPRSARLIREGASIVLAGRPNVGKSSIMNALLHAERAIVTEIPGTTRDVLTERISLGGICAEISDTAGQRLTDDPVEKIGVNRAVRAMETADVVVMVFDGSQPLQAEDEELLQKADARSIICVNKRDLPQAFDLPQAVKISCRTGEGVENLLDELKKRVAVDNGSENRLIQERHLRLAAAAADSLKNAVGAIEAQLALDVIEIDLRQALDKLCEITGEEASEEVIDRVFKNFCVGK